VREPQRHDQGVVVSETAQQMRAAAALLDMKGRARRKACRIVGTRSDLDAVLTQYRVLLSELFLILPWCLGVLPGLCLPCPTTAVRAAPASPG
jgi:hypothetical protein